MKIYLFSGAKVVFLFDIGKFFLKKSQKKCIFCGLSAFLPAQVR